MQSKEECRRDARTDGCETILLSKKQQWDASVPFIFCGTAALSKQQRRQKGCDYLGSGGKDIRARQDMGKEGEGGGGKQPEKKARGRARTREDGKEA